MIKTSLAVIAAAMALMVGTAMFASRSGPPENSQITVDARMMSEKLPAVDMRQKPKHNDIRIGQAVAPAPPSTTPATPAVAPVAATVAPAATPVPAPMPDLKPGEKPYLSTDLIPSVKPGRHGVLDYVRDIIRFVARFMSTAEDNVWVIMAGVAFTLFLTTGFWQFHAITEERHLKNEATSQDDGLGGCGPSGSGSCKTKGACH